MSACRCANGGFLRQDFTAASPPSSPPSPPHRGMTSFAHLSAADTLACASCAPAISLPPHRYCSPSLADPTRTFRERRGARDPNG
eukprot:4685050-Pyramimonas_sp.AAC.1